MYVQNTEVIKARSIWAHYDYTYILRNVEILYNAQTLLELEVNVLASESDADLTSVQTSVYKIAFVCIISNSVMKYAAG